MGELARCHVGSDDCLEIYYLHLVVVVIGDENAFRLTRRRLVGVSVGIEHLRELLKPARAW